jgi:hypothetical protein
LPEAERDALLDAIEIIFGIAPSTFDDRSLWTHTGSGTVWMTSREAFALPRGLKVEAMGMVLLRVPSQPANVSNAFVRRFGQLATRSVLDVDAVGEATFLDREPVPHDEGPDAKGYRIVRGPSGPLGRGLVQGELVVSQVPKSLRVRRP